MANRTQWTAGNGVGLTWTSCFASADLTSLVDSKAILSSSTAVSNGTSLDMYADISVEITVTSSTPRSGGFIAMYLALANQDGTTFGDGILVAGTSLTYTPPYAPVGMVSLANTAMTLMAGTIQGILLPPGSFNFVLYNFSNVTFSATASNNVVKYRTYNVNLNN